jgi:uncharacterized protein YihD (DUF1040 family)
MKYLLTCFLAGCLVSPVWGSDRDMALEKLIQKLAFEETGA